MSTVLLEAQKKGERMDENEQVVKQGRLPLPYLDEEVPALYLADGKPYIPLFAICHALGIEPAPHIRRWRTLLLWETARKLPFHTKKQGTRLVWCLLISEVPFLYRLFNWDLLSPERRVRVRQAAKEGAKLAGRAYQEMQAHYKETRKLLFAFLTEFAGMDATLQAYLLVPPQALAVASYPLYTEHVEQGRKLYQETAAHARAMLQEQEGLPVIDVLHIATDTTMPDSSSMPLFPIISEEDDGRLQSLLVQLASWSEGMATFWGVGGKSEGLSM